MLKRVLAGFVLVVGCLFAGALFGIVAVRLLRPTTSSGWDGIADALGGLMLGGGTGLVVAIVALFTVRARLPLAAGIAWLALIVAVALIRIVPAQKLALPVQPDPFEPTYVIQLYSRIAASEPGSPDLGFPYRELRVDANYRSLTVKRWGSPPPVCSTGLDDAQLATLVPLIEAIDAPEDCAPEGPGFSLIIDWPEQPQRGYFVEPGCLARDPELAAFVEAFERLRAATCTGFR